MPRQSAAVSTCDRRQPVHRYEALQTRPVRCTICAYTCGIRNINARPLVAAAGGSVYTDTKHAKPAQFDAPYAHIHAAYATSTHAGIFETMRIENGRPLDVEAHLFRLEASARAVFGAQAATSARD